MPTAMVDAARASAAGLESADPGGGRAPQVLLSYYKTFY